MLLQKQLQLCQKIQKCVKKLSKFIRMWGIDYRLIVFLNKITKLLKILDVLKRVLTS